VQVFSFGGEAMNQIREGDLYRKVTIEDVLFEIRYGYMCENERLYWEVSPVYPNFIKNPTFTKEGYPFATVYQDRCQFYHSKANPSDEHWCNDCVYFEKHEDYIGICRCEKNRRDHNEQHLEVQST